MQQWSVFPANSSSVETVYAEFLRVIDGALVFSSDLQFTKLHGIETREVVVRAFAPGTWSHVEHKGKVT